MTNVYGYMVTHNEADRYLEQALTSMRQLTDRFVVYDDCSTDNTVEMVKALDIPVVIRDATHEKSFLENESLFRQRAWEVMENELVPQDGDWILTLDADEILLPEDIGELQNIMVDAEAHNGNGIVFPVREIFGSENEWPQVRTDGFWGSINALRFVKWYPNSSFKQRVFAGGSVPDTVTVVAQTPHMEILHFGYMHSEDRIAKHQRYRNRPGHNPDHIRSILEPGRLTPWEPLQSVSQPTATRPNGSHTLNVR